MGRGEIEIFRKFIPKCPYPIQKGSIQKMSPPEPDILCKLEDGEEKYFELVECVDAYLAESLSLKIPVGGFLPTDGQIWTEPLEKKFIKKYPKICELFAYYDRQPIIAENTWLLIMEDYIKNNLKRSQFKRVWIYSVPQERILFTYPNLGV